MRGENYKPVIEHSFNRRGALSLHFMKNCIEEGKYKDRQKLLGNYTDDMENNP